jgi:hypothetical protein
MHRFKALIVFVAAALGGITPALAGELDGTVSPVLTSVSLSIGGSEPAASYTVTLENTSNSGALNVTRLVGTTSVTGGASGAKAVFKSATGASCTVTNIDKTSIDCNAGGLAQGALKTFTVTFTAPTSGANIAFAWTAVFDNGTPPGNSNGDAGTTYIGLDPIDIEKVTSDIPLNVAVTFFTGNGVATAADPWVTIVKVPSTGQTAKATVLEDSSVSQCAPDLLDCRTSTLTIDGITFGDTGERPLSVFLEVTLRRDATTIAKGAKIDTAVLYYKHDPEVVGLGVPIASCADTSLPKLETPCEDLTKRKAYPKRNTGKTPVGAGFEADWEFVIYLHDNGRITN